MSAPFPTGEQVYDRLKWDERFDLDRIQIVFSLRPSGTKVVPYREFDLTTIPWHRIVEYRLDGEVFWSRHDRIDRITELAARTGFRRTAGGGDVERVEPAALETTSLVPQRFDGTRWRPFALSEAAGRVEGSAIRVATWNVLFDRFDAELLDSDRRWTALLSELAASSADLIALQEVTPGFLRRLLDQDWIRRDFAISDVTGSSVDPHGQVLLSRLPLVECSVTRLAPHRRLLWARVAAGPLDLGVAVVHLASDRASGAADTRADELRAVAGHVRATPHAAWIVTGDFNSVEEENAAVLRGLDAADTWRALRDEPGFTFDFEKNALAGALSQRRRSGRFDRILSLTGTAARLRPTAVQLLGETATGGLFPSDHFGVAATLAVERAESAGIASAPASKRAALVLMPPSSLWGPVQRIRCRFDRGFARWPPHVTLLYEFVDPSWIEEAGRLVDELVARRKPFEIAFDRPARFEQAVENTHVLEPSGTGRAALLSLRGEILALFPELEAVREYRPHLTVARTPKGSRDERAIESEIARAAESLRWSADRLSLLRRRDVDDAFEVVHESRFATYARPRAPSPPREAASLLAAVSSAASQLAGYPVPVERFGSTRYAPALAADTDLLVLAGRRADAPAFAAGLAAALVAEPALNQVSGANLIEGRFDSRTSAAGRVKAPTADARAKTGEAAAAEANSAPGISDGASRKPGSASWKGPSGTLREVPGEGLFGLRGSLGGREVDIAIVFADSIEDGDDRTLPENARRALLGPRDADVLVDRLKKHGRYETFLALLPMVKHWADARAIRSNAFGYTSSFGWALLLAPPLLHDEMLSGVDAEHALPAWFEWLAALPDGVDVTLDPVLVAEPGKRLRVRSPAAPFRNAGRSFTGSTESVLRAEISLAVRRTRGLTGSADALERAAIPLENDPPKGTLIEIRGVAESRGAYEGAFLSLLVALERALGDRVRPWGRVSDESGEWTHRIAIDGSPAEAIRAVVEPWLERSFPAASRPRLS